MSDMDPCHAECGPQEGLKSALLWLSVWFPDQALNMRNLLCHCIPAETLGLPRKCLTQDSLSLALTWGKLSLERAFQMWTLQWFYSETQAGPSHGFPGPVTSAEEVKPSLFGKQGLSVAVSPLIHDCSQRWKPVLVIGSLCFVHGGSSWRAKILNHGYVPAIALRWWYLASCLRLSVCI